jgi:hypothetical protein
VQLDPPNQFGPVIRSIHFQACNGLHMIKREHLDEEGDRTTHDADEHDLWQAGYVRIELVHRLTTAIMEQHECPCDGGNDACRCTWCLAAAFDDALAEGPEDEWGGVFADAPQGYLPELSESKGQPT